MKKICSVLLAVVMLFAIAAPIQPVRGVTESSAVAYRGTVVADGNLAEWQAVEEKYDLQNRVVDGTAQTTGYFQVMWDADFLYMAGEIYDATNNGGNDLLKVLFDLDGVPAGDGVVTFADRANAGVHTTSPIGYNPNGGANAWNPLNAWNGYLNPGHTVVAGYDSYVNYVEDAGKYTFEIKWYPSAAMKAKLKAGETIGLDVQWSDYNGGTHANDPAITTIGWSSQLVDWNNDLRTIGSLTLLEQAGSAEKQVEIFKGVPTIDGDLTEWADDTPIELSKLTGDGEDSGWIKLKWDEKGIYVGGQIVDANKEDDDILKFVLDFDGVSDADSSVSFGSRNNAGVYSWMMWGYCGNDNNPKNPNPWNPQNTYGNNMAAGTDVLGDGVNLHMMMTQYTQGVYNFEMTLHPNDSLKAKLSEGSTIGFDMQWVDRNQSASLNDTKNTVLGWASNEPGWTGDLRKLGRLMLTQYQKPTDETDYICATDERLTYLGRWTEEESVKVSYWNAPSVSFDFSGESLYLDLDRKSAIVVELDGVVTTYNAVEGIRKIPVAGEGQHSVKIYGPGMHLKGFYIAKDSVISKTLEKPYYAIFIGDSISEDLRSATFNAGRLAGWDWSVYALGGIALSDGNGYYNGRGHAWGYYNDGYYAEDPMAGWDGTTRVGMETAFFNYERPIDKASNFTPYNGFEQERQPNAIFIALGVNDYLQNQTQSNEFVSDYAAFVQKLRGYYPYATIYIVQALNDNGYGLRQASITRAANVICAQDENVVFLADTPQWNVELSSDNTHPSEKGYATVTQKVTQILKEFGVQGVEIYRDTPKIDGDLSEWAADTKLDIQNKLTGHGNTNGWFKAKWDGEAIYLAGEIYDATHEGGNDLLKVLFDLDGVAVANEVVAFADRPNAGVHTTSEIGYNPNGGVNVWNPLNAYGSKLPAGNNVVSGCESVITYVEADSKYIFETKWYASDAMKAKLTEGGSIGLDIQWSDLNGGTYGDDPRITNVSWFSKLVDWNNDLRTIGKLDFATSASQGVAHDTPTLDGDLTEWEGCKQYNLSKLSGDAEDSGWFKLKWDENAIYVGGRVMDATKEDGDILKFFVDFDGAASGENAVTFATRPNAGVYSWMMWGYSGDGSTHVDPKPWNPIDSFGTQVNAGADVLGDGVNSHMLVVNYQNGAYIFEMVLYPTDALKARLTGDTVLGFDLQWVDYNGATSAQDTKNTTLGWASNEKCWSTDLRKVGSIKLLQKVHKVTYRVDGETVAVYNVTHGQDVTNIPQLPERTYYTGSWNHDGTNITADIVIDAVYTPNVRVDQWNLSLGGDVALNFYLAVADISLNGVVVKATYKNQIRSVPVSQLEKTENDTYKLTVHMAAAQMTEPVTLQLLIDDVEVQSKAYTIRQYADRILFGEYSQTVKTLVREMLHYGAAAQTYFAYRQENPANVDILVGSSVPVPTEEPTAVWVEDNVSGLSFYGSTLLFETKTKVRFYLSGDISGCSFQINGTDKKAVKKDDLWYIESDGFNPQTLDQSVVLTVQNGNSTLTVSYSPMNYMVRMSSKGSENLQALLKAMYNYHLAAAGKIAHTDYDQDWSDASCVVNDLGTWEYVDCIDNPNNWTVAFNHTAYNWTDPDDDYDWGVNVIRVGDTYKMWWTRENPWDSIWYAESTDLKKWTNAQCIAGFKHWNDYYPNVKQHIADPAVVYVDGVYYFWFETCASVNEDMAANGDGVIIHATSTDGIHLNWYGGNNDPQPVLKPADKDMNQGIYGVGMPSVIYKDGKFMMYYYDGKYDVMRLAISEDGIHFPENANNPIVFDKAGASFTYNTLTGKYLMTVCAASVNGTGEAVYVQESEDGINWICSSWRQLAEKTMVVSGSAVKMRCFADFVKNPYGMVDTATIFMTYTEGDMPAAGEWWMSTNPTFEAYFTAVNLPEFAKRPVETP